MLDSILHNSKDKIDFIIAMIVIILAGFFIIYYSLESETDPIQGESADQMLADSLVIDGELYIPYAHPEEEEQLIKSDRELESAEIRSEEPYVVDTSYRNRINTASTGNIVIDTLASLEKEADTMTLEIDTLSMAQGHVVVNDTIVEVEEESEKQIESETLIEVDDPRSCVIVIGAYGNEKNKNNLVSKLESAGYDVFQVPYKGLTRVGVYMSCEDEQLDIELSKVKANYASDAVVLTKQALN